MAAPPAVAPTVAAPAAAYAAPAAPAPATAAAVSRWWSNRLGLKIALGGGVALLLVVAYFVSGPLFAGMESKSQTQALQQTGTDLTKIDAFLSDTQVRDSKKTDAASFKVAIDAYQAKLTDTAATLASDQDRLDGINRDIDFYALFTPFQSSQVHSNDGTIRHAKAALNAVAKAVGIFRTQEAFYSSMVGAEANADSADKAAKAKDLTSATVYYQKAVSDLGQCTLLVKDADVPPQFAPLVVLLSKVMTDVAGLADTVNANDGLGALKYLQQLIADDAVLTFDQTAYLNWYSAKIDPIQKEFRRNAVAVPRYVVTDTKLV